MWVMFVDGYPLGVAQPFGVLVAVAADILSRSRRKRMARPTITLVEVAA